MKKLMLTICLICSLALAHPEDQTVIDIYNATPVTYDLIIELLNYVIDHPSLNWPEGFVRQCAELLAKYGELK